MDGQQKHFTTSSATSPSRPTSPFPGSNDDKATASYIRRTLCAHHAISAGPVRSIHELLPPLTSSNTVDLQLYAIIAVILKEFVQAWYGKITSDHAFIDEVLLVIAHCTRSLEARARTTDFEGLLFDEIPHLFEQHVSAYRTSQQTASNQHLDHKATAIYHTLYPHPALHPIPDITSFESIIEQGKNEQAWRHMLVQSLLVILLPSEDLQNDCFRSLAEEILAEMIIGNIISNRLCQPWALWELITNIVQSTKASRPRSAESDAPHTVHDNNGGLGSSDRSPRNKSRLAQFGLLSNPLSIDQQSNNRLPSTDKPRFKALTDTLWSIIGCIVLLFTMIRSLLVIVSSFSKLPARMEYLNTRGLKPRPIMSMGIWSAVTNLIEVPIRMPWLSGVVCLAKVAVLSGPGRVAGPDSKLDRLLSHAIQTRILDPAHLPTVLRSVRRTFFPANTFPRQVKSLPNEAAIIEIKSNCTKAILDTIPVSVRATYFSTTDVNIQLAIVESWLDVFSDAYMNKHLILGLLELCIVRLVPELLTAGPEELLVQRL